MRRSAARLRDSATSATLLLALSSPGPLMASVHVHAVRVGMDSNHTRLVLESDQPIRAHLLHGASTCTLQLKLDDVDARGTLAGLGQAIGANNPFLLSGAAEGSATGARLVLTTRAGVRTRLSQFKAGAGFGARLVLDVFPAPSSAVQDAACPTSRMPTSPRNVVIPTVQGQLAQQTTPSAVQVLGTRVGVAPDRVRLILESDRPIAARVVHPTTPGALSIELGDVPLNAALLGLPQEIGANPYLTTVRLEHDASGTRIRLLAPAPVQPLIFNLLPGDGHGNRLVIDVFPERILPSTPSVAAAAATVEILSAAPKPMPIPAPAEPVPTLVRGPKRRAMVEAWLEVHVNGVQQGTTLILRGDDGEIYVQPDDLQRWRLNVSCEARIPHGTDAYCPLTSIKGVSYRIDEARAMLSIDVPAALLAQSHLSGMSRATDMPTPSPPGGYLNYDVFAGRENTGPTKTSAVVEAGLFGRFGSGNSTLLSRHTEGNTRMIRLDTTWTRDEPERMASLRLGDAISGTSSWGRAVRMGGVQWATNFATRPTFVTLPLPTVEGVAATPSTVDYYVNDALRLRREVPSGPFTIQDLPVVTGAGDIRMVVRDLLGREQVVSRPFYAASGILAKGLRDYSYELGFERKNYGLASNDYGPPIAVGTERLGLSDHVTGEVHAELLQDRQTIGLGGDFLVGNLGLLSVAVAGSRAASGTGGLMELGFQRQSSHLSYGARSQFTTSGFTQLGYETPARPPRQTTSAFFSMGTSVLGSFGMNYTHQEFRGAEDIELLGASYSHSVGRVGYLSLSALRFLEGDRSTLVSMIFTMPLGNTDNLSVGGQASAGSAGGSLQFQHNLPAGSGAGYRVQAGLSANDPDLAEVTMQNNVGTYMLGAAQNRGKLAYRASVRGGVAMLANKMFFSRHIDDSFAVVRVPGFPGVRVYADNQPVAVTDEAGYAMVPQLRSYQRNPIRIEQADLPLGAQIHGLQLDAVPYYRSAVTLTFPVSSTRGAIVTIKLTDGSFLPPGATVLVEGNPATFPVGYNGETYLTGLQATNKLHASWRGQSCDMTVAFPPGDDPLPRIGPITCAGVRP